MIKNLTILLLLLGIISCSKEKEIMPEEQLEVNHWLKFVGNYKVYDTIGNFMYNMDIAHYSVIHYPNGHKTDSLVITNFADTFDLKFPFSEKLDKRYLDFYSDSLVDYNNKSWNISGLADDESTTKQENAIINDTLIMFFRQTNIKFYINESQPYYYCECKHVAVKQ